MRFLLKIIRYSIIIFVASTVLAVVAYRFLPVYVTPLMVIRLGEQAVNGQSLKWHHTWKPLEKISPHLPVAVMASEDQRFLLHHGFDFDAISKAVEHNKKGGTRHGASTITQQTAKNVFLWHDRTWFRKGLETYFTFLIELFWSKQRIMEVYLNSIEMGNGIYGAEAVAKHNFGKTAEILTRSECALIAVTLPNPRVYNSAAPSTYIQKRQRKIEREMKFMPSFPKEGQNYDPKTSAGGIYSR